MLLLLSCVAAVARGRHTSRRPRPHEVTSEPRRSTPYSTPRISRGYCGVTLAQSDCATSSMGSWAESNASRCIERCFGCARCNFISFRLT